MAVSEHDREYMRRLAKASAELEAQTGPPSPETRRWMIRWSNERRAKRGIPPLEEVEEDEHPPELEFYRKARERGMLRDRKRSA
ncbi:MAG: hypothetical protein ACT4PI_02090 [Actinomycetota bacterium]